MSVLDQAERAMGTRPLAQPQPAETPPATEVVHTPKPITVYVCPTPECPSYFGSSGMGDLSTQFTGPKVENKDALRQATGSDAKHTRAACQLCRVRGIEVERVALHLVVAVPMVGPPTPELPRHS